MNNHHEGVAKWILSWVTGTYIGASQLGMCGAMPIYDVHICNICTPQAELTPRNPEAGSAYRLSPQSPESKEARIKLWGITTHIQAKGSKFP